MPGCSACLATLPVFGPAAIAALIAVPSACVTATAGIVDRRGGHRAGQHGRGAGRVVGDHERLGAERLGDLRARRYVHWAAAVPPSTTAIQFPAGSGAG